jgi:hypothetical protein
VVASITRTYSAVGTTIILFIRHHNRKVQHNIATKPVTFSDIFGLKWLFQLQFLFVIRYFFFKFTAFLAFVWFQALIPYNLA